MESKISLLHLTSEAIANCASTTVIQKAPQRILYVLKGDFDHRKRSVLPGSVEGPRTMSYSDSGWQELEVFASIKDSWLKSLSVPYFLTQQFCIRTTAPCL